MRVSYGQLIKRFAGRPLISVGLLILFVGFLLDFIIGLPSRPSHWVYLGLILGILVQGEGLRKEPGQFSGQLALFAGSLVLMMIVSELIFVLFLVETQHPKSQREFLRLMSYHRLWPEPISVAKTAGTFRILGLSDSFGTAGGSSNYHYLLEDVLRGGVSPAIQMVNVSVPGYEPVHQLAILRFAMPYSPDVVLHGVFVGNDFHFPVEDKYIYRRIYIITPQDSSPYRPRNFLIRYWVENSLEPIKERWRTERELATGVVSSVGEMSKSKYLEVQLARMRNWSNPAQKNVNTLRKVFPVLDAIRSVAQEYGARYVMVIHPDVTQVDEHLRRDIVKTFHLNGAKYDFELPQELLTSYCLERGIPCLDLLPVFRAMGASRDLYLVRGTHYNEAGNELAAVTIAGFLRDNHLVPSSREN